MSKNSKGFFLSETIIVLALVTTAIAFVLPNVMKLYENYVNQTEIYDTTEDIYFLKAIIQTNSICDQIKSKTRDEKDNRIEIPEKTKLDFNDVASIELSDNFKLDQLYIASYMSEQSDEDYEFNKYLKRLKKTNYDASAYRIIGSFKETNKENYRFASIKINSYEIEECN